MALDSGNMPIFDYGVNFGDLTISTGQNLPYPLTAVRANKVFAGQFTNIGIPNGNDGNTVLLIQCDDENDGSTNFIDTSIGGSTHILTANGNAQIDTAIVKSGFGTGSALFDGTGDYLSIPDSADWAFGSNPFTIETWFRTPAISYQAIFASHTDLWMGMLLLPSGKIGYFASSNGTSWDLLSGDSGSFNGEGTITLSANTWHHIALSRDGNVWRGFVDGAVDISPTVSGSIVTRNENRNIGRWGAVGYYANGWIDEFRISKGIARYTGPFTPQSEKYGIFTRTMYTDARFDGSNYTIELYADSNRRYLIGSYTSASSSDTDVIINGIGVGDGSKFTISYAF